MALFDERRAASAFGDVRSAAPLNSAFSPDGTWIAYPVRSPVGADSDQAVCVQPLPATGAVYPVSPQGDSGHHSFGSRDGGEIFYFAGSMMVSAPVTLGAGAAFGNAELVPARIPAASTEFSPLNYDVEPDGRAFFWTKPVGLAKATPRQAKQLRVV